MIRDKTTETTINYPFQTPYTQIWDRSDRHSQMNSSNSSMLKSQAQWFILKLFSMCFCLFSHQEENQVTLGILVRKRLAFILVLLCGCCKSDGVCEAVNCRNLHRHRHQWEKAAVGIIIKVFLTRRWPEVRAGSGVSLCLMSSDQGPRCWRSFCNCFTVAPELDSSWLFVQD